MSDHLFTVESSHVVTNGDDWYTPRWIFDAAGIEFDMDVASPMDPEMQHVPARRFITAVEDGLATDWAGTIWCNPPYSGSTPWVEKWAAHEGQGMLLVPAVKSRWVGTFARRSRCAHAPDGRVSQAKRTGRPDSMADFVRGVA